MPSSHPPLTPRPSPLVILVRPQMGENIGAVARAMSNFGLGELRIVAPRDGWPNTKAWEMAAGGKPIIEAAQVFPDFVAGMHDIQLAYATTARPRDMEKRVVTPEVAMAEIAGYISSPNRGEAGRGAQYDRPLVSRPHPNPPPNGEGISKIALIFGPERTGLENEEISWCDTIISIPTAPENWSLNLGQSMVVLGYEWWKQSHLLPLQGGGSRRGSNFDAKETPTPPSPCKGEGLLGPATKSDWEGMFGQLESYLDQAEYFRVSDKKSIMWQNIRTMLLRSQMSEQELRTFRGMLRLMWEGRKPRV